LNLTQKLHPTRLSGMTSKMVAIVGFVLGETFTQPAIAAIFVTSDGFALAQNVGEVGFNSFIGCESGLRRNWQNLLVAAELTGEEREEACRLFALKLSRPS